MQKLQDMTIATAARENQKRRYQDARTRAQAIAASVSKFRITVSHTAAVQLVEDGAFVEAIIWVPDK